MKLSKALLRGNSTLADDVAELALRMAMERGDHSEVANWLVKQTDPSPQIVGVVLGGQQGADMCLKDHRLLPLVSTLAHADQETVLHGLVDAFRAGRVRHWYGHSALVRLALRSSDDDVRKEVLEPWFVRAALTSTAEMRELLDEYNSVDPAGVWLKALLEREEDLPIEVLAVVSANITPAHAACGSLPWVVNGGEEWAESGYAAKLLELAASMVPRSQWGVLAQIGADWQGTLGDLVRCVQEIS